MLRRIYDWCIAAADKPYALWILTAISFAESSFFPVPPDIMLVPMSLAKPRRAWRDRRPNSEAGEVRVGQSESDRKTTGECSRMFAYVRICSDMFAFWRKKCLQRAGNFEPDRLPACATGQCSSRLATTPRPWNTVGLKVTRFVS